MLFNPVNPKWGVRVCGVMIKAMDCGIVVSEFEFQSRYDIHIQTNTLR